MSSPLDRPLFPVDPTLDNLIGFFQNHALLQSLANSVIVSTGTAVLSVLVGGLMAYSLSKFRYRGRNAIMFMFLIGQLIPGRTAADLALPDAELGRAALHLHRAHHLVHDVHAAARPCSC